MKQNEELQRKYNELLKEHESLQDKLISLATMSYVMLDLDWSYTQSNISGLSYNDNKVILSEGQYGNWSNRDSYARTFNDIITYMKEKKLVNRMITENEDDIYLLHFINNYFELYA